MEPELARIAWHAEVRSQGLVMVLNSHAVAMFGLGEIFMVCDPSMVAGGWLILQHRNSKGWTPSLPRQTQHTTHELFIIVISATSVTTHLYKLDLAQQRALMGIKASDGNLLRGVSSV